MKAYRTQDEVRRLPSQGWPINRADPVTRGLYLLSYGNVGFDIVSGRVPTLTAATGGFQRGEPALSLTGGSTQSYEHYVDTLGAVDELSVLVVGAINNPSNRQALFTKGEDNPAGEWSLSMGYNAGGAYSNFFFQSVQTGPTTADALGTTTVAAAEEFAVLGTYKRNDAIRIYKNGVLEGSTATANNALRTDSVSPPLAFGMCNISPALGGNFYFAGTMKVRAVWTRALPQAEAEYVTRRWLKVFAPEPRVVYFDFGAPAGLAANPARGGGAAINPIWGMAA